MSICPHRARHLHPLLPHLITGLLQKLYLGRFVEEAISDLLKSLTQLYQPSLQGHNQLNQTFHVKTGACFKEKQLCFVPFTSCLSSHSLSVAHFSL